MKNIEKIILQFEHEIFKIEGKGAKDLLDYIEQHMNIYTSTDWEIINRKPFKEKV